MRPSKFFSLFFVLFLLAACVPSPPVSPVPGVPSPASSAQPVQDANALTARELTAPGALAGPRPSSFNWSPAGAQLAYVEPQGGQDVLWLYDAASGEKRLLLDPAAREGNIDVTSSQWSPNCNQLLLTGDEAFWLLDVTTGELTSLAAGGEDTTSVIFTCPT